MDKQSDFDAEAYAQKLVAGGIDKEAARQTAEKMKAARQAPAGAFDLAAAAASAPARPAAMSPAAAAATAQAIATSTAVTAPPDTSDPAGDAPPAKKKGARAIPARKVPRLIRDDRLIEAGAEISSLSPSGDDMAFMHSVLCQVGLPRSKVDGTEFVRKSGASALSISAGKLWDGKEFVQQPIPYGPLPRLILAYMNTWAVRHKTPVIPVGDSAAEFMRMIGKGESTGGATGSLTNFKRQVFALAACRLTLGFNAGGRAITYDGKPISAFEAWLPQGDQPALWPAEATYSSEYYETLIGRAIPIDWRAYTQLKGSALAMDAYTWAADRLHRITGRPVQLSWKALREQFAQEYQGKDADKDFKKKFLLALKDVLTVYPHAKIQQINGGLLLYPSAPPIPYKD